MMAADDSFHLVFLHGLPGVGKLSTGKLLTTKYLPTYKLLHNHMIMEPLKSFFKFASPSFVKLRELHWIQLLEECFKSKMEKKSEYVNDFDSAIDGIIFTFPFEYSVSKEFLINVMDLSRKYPNVTVSFIELICSEDTLMKRVTNKDREQNGKLTDAKMLKEYIANGKLYSGHSYIEQTLGQKNIKINTEGHSLDAVAKIVRNEIQKCKKENNEKNQEIITEMKPMTNRQILINGYCRRIDRFFPMQIACLLEEFCGVLLNALEVGDEIDWRKSSSVWTGGYIHGWTKSKIVDKVVIQEKNLLLLQLEQEDHSMFTTLVTKRRDWKIMRASEEIICRCAESNPDRPYCNNESHGIAECLAQSSLAVLIDEVD